MMMAAGAVSAGDTKAFVATENGVIAVFDIDQVESGAPVVVNHINTGGGVWGITTNKGTNKVYVTDPVLNRLLRIDVATQAITDVALATQFKNPMGIAVHPINGDIYIANANTSATSGSVAIVDPITLAVRSTISISGNPYMLKFNEDGSKLLVTDYFRARVYRINAAAGNTIKTYTISGAPVASYNYGIAYSDTYLKDRMFLPIHYRDKLYSYSSSGTEPFSVYTLATTLTGNPSDIVIPKGATYAFVSKFSGSDVMQIELVGTPKTVLNWPVSTQIRSSPLGMTLSPYQTRLYVANYSNRTVSILDVAPGSPTFGTPIAMDVPLGSGVGGAIAVAIGQLAYCSGY